MWYNVRLTKHLFAHLAVPYWNLTGNLVSLSLQLGEDDYCYFDPVRNEQLETTVTSFEPPAELPALLDLEANTEINYSVASRTIVAAARGGHLRHLDVNCSTCPIQRPFAVRGLLPFWVGIEKWGDDFYANTRRSMMGWASAAQALSASLQAISCWLNDKNDLRLSGEQVRSMRSHLKAREDEGSHSTDGVFDSARTDSPANFYLCWLEEDAELS